MYCSGHLAQFLPILSCQSWLFIAFLNGFFVLGRAGNSYGVVGLDNLTLHKVLDRFPYTVVRFDVSYPYGDKHDEYLKFAVQSNNQKDLLIADVLVSDYADKMNKDLADVYKLSESDFPALFIFKKDDVTHPLKFEGSAFQVDEIKRWVRETTGLWLGLSGCLESFDKLVSGFVTISSQDKRQEMISEAEARLSRLTEKSEIESGEIYVKYMRRALEKDSEFVFQEVKRVEKLTNDAKTSENKRQRLKIQNNILHSFLNEGARDEL